MIYLGEFDFSHDFYEINLPLIPQIICYENYAITVDI